jgi:deazaflavin-dependent oxidoreductase (nitroreductase family)
MKSQTVHPVSRRQRVANRLLTRALRKGRGPGFMRLLTVRGRTSGRPYTTPVVPVVEGGHMWLVCPYGDVSWVRNLRAVGVVELARGDDRATYAAHELGATEAVPVLRAYLSMPSARFVRHDFDVTARSTDQAIADEAPRHPVFALTPAEP